MTDALHEQEKLVMDARDYAENILETMRALMDPMVLFEEAEDTLVSMQELSQIEWPDDKRPGE